MNLQLENQKILVTGATGFIGRHLTEELLRRKLDVTVLIHRKSHPSFENGKTQVIQADICDFPDLQMFDVIFHLAASINVSDCLKNPRKTFEVNVLGTLNLLEKTKESVKRFVFTSTMGVYGRAEKIPTDEDQPLLPRGLYATSKLAAENVILSYKRSCGVNAVIARIANCYGEEQNDDLIIPCIIQQILTKNVVELGCTTTVRDFIYIKDVVTAIILLAEKGEADIYNVGSGIGTPVGKLPEILADITNKYLQVFSLKNRTRDLSLEIDQSVADISKICKLDWSVKYSLLEGLQRTCDYYCQKMKL